MTPHNKIAIVYDTNNFISSKNKVFDLTKLNFEKYYKFKKTLKMNGLEDKVELFFPEIVLLELIKNHENRLNNEIINFKNLNKKFNNFPDTSITGFEKINVELLCENLKLKYINELKIIPIPEDKTKLFENILEMAINRYPPLLKRIKTIKMLQIKDLKMLFYFYHC